jgi:quercetin dioxygenase-like cupin family protein
LQEEASWQPSSRKGIKRTDLQQHDLSISGREVIQARVDIGPEAPLVKHTHPGEEIIYVLERSLEYQIEGQSPTTYKAGEVLLVPAGTVHAVRNVGSGNAAELAPQAAAHLVPWIQLPALVGEGSLCLWLLVVGTNLDRWKQQATAAIRLQSRQLEALR